jgi:phosphatidate cytidylyltransferase
MTEQKKSQLGNLASRVLVAVIAAPFLLLAMYQDRHEFVWGLVFCAWLIAIYEFCAMTLADHTDRIATVVCGAAAVAALYWVPVHRGGMLLPLFLAFVPMAIYYVFRFGDMDTVASRLAASVAAIVYGGLLFTFVALIKRDAGSGHWILLILVVPWSSDTGAYTLGRLFGKAKLYPAVSPGKTRAGGVGGLLGACIATACIKYFALPNALEWVDVAVFGLVGGALCQIGDLVESLIKRSTGIKDSGKIFAGHGGMLDRLDAVLFFAPFVYLYLLTTA